MPLFRRRKRVQLTSVAEQRFDAMMDLIKDLPKKDYNNLKDAMDLGYNAYQKVRGVQTFDEKELNLSEIDDIERVITKAKEAKE